MNLPCRTKPIQREARLRHTLVLIMASLALWSLTCHPVSGRLTADESEAVVGDAPMDPDPLAAGLSGEVKSSAVQDAMRKFADWQAIRVAVSPSRHWTFATPYVGMLLASETLHRPRYCNIVAAVADHYHGVLGPRETHADDQAIGQAYLRLYQQKPDPQRIQPLKTKFDEVMQEPDDPTKPVWWWWFRGKSSGGSSIRRGYWAPEILLHVVLATRCGMLGESAANAELWKTLG